jgi:hypothetical protein
MKQQYSLLSRAHALSPQPIIVNAGQEQGRAMFTPSPRRMPLMYVAPLSRRRIQEVCPRRQPPRERLVCATGAQRPFSSGPGGAARRGRPGPKWIGTLAANRVVVGSAAAKKKVARTALECYEPNNDRPAKHGGHPQ